jgi:hypothetical protein
MYDMADIKKAEDYLPCINEKMTINIDIASGRKPAGILHRGKYNSDQIDKLLKNLNELIGTRGPFKAAYESVKMVMTPKTKKPVKRKVYVYGGIRDVLEQACDGCCVNPDDVCIIFNPRQQSIEDHHS